MNVAAPKDGNVKFTISQLLLPYKDEVRDGNVAIHLRQGYGGQDVKVLLVPVFNANEEW